MGRGALARRIPAHSRRSVQETPGELSAERPMSRVLVLANSIVPLPGLPTNGGGLRAWTLARGLESAGHAVTLLFPRHSLDEQLVPIRPDARAAALPHTFSWERVDEAILE